MKKIIINKIRKMLLRFFRTRMMNEPFYYGFGYVNVKVNEKVNDKKEDKKFYYGFGYL